MGAAPDAGQPLIQSSSLLVELENGAWKGAAAFPQRILTISIAECAAAPGSPGKRTAAGAASVIYRPVEWAEPPPDHFVTSSEAAEDVVARLRAGALSTNDALSLAVQFRESKHFNPAFGAIAAYLYDAAGDRDSIRRVAWFYPYMSQPIPFDVALLGGFSGRRDGSWRIFVDLPAVPARAPRTAAELQHPDYFCALLATSDVAVAGGFPWLREGWALLDIARLPVNPAVAELHHMFFPHRSQPLIKTGGGGSHNLSVKGRRKCG